MDTLLTLLGFTGVSSILWNLGAYFAFVLIILGVSSGKHRNTLITLGATYFAFYAGWFLHNTLFMVLQIIVVISGLFVAVKIPRHISGIIMVFLTLASYVSLFVAGAVTDVWSFIGSIGLLGIAFGLIAVPKRLGFAFMAIGGTLLLVYAVAVVSVAYIFLNFFFAANSIKEWQKKTPQTQ
jgi:hypothetical protein